MDWSSRQPLEETGPGRFRMVDRPQRTFVFTRASGRVARVAIAGMDANGEFSRLGPRTLPAEDLAAGRGRAAWAKARRDPEYLAVLALMRRIFDQRASTAPAFREFVEAAFAAGHRDSATLASLGLARVAAGDRAAARAAFEAALRANPGSGEAREALRMMDGAAETGWTVPFSLDAAYAPPTADEVRRVEAAWAERDLSPREVRVEDRFPAGAFDVEVVSHLVHGSRHFGAILAPRGAAPRSLPLVLEVKGVSWNFFPLAVPEGSTALEVLGPAASGFVIALPGLRGETLAANGRAWVSEGDPAESWDGATDDALAFLEVVLQRAEAVDPARIAAFGRSRGGSVALLAGERDRRIARVLAWSAPAGWIEDMRHHGWTQREMVGEGLRRRSAATMIGGQSVRTFLRRAVEGAETLQQVRFRLIASSPVYFARRLPKTAAWWGVDDPIVEPGNGERIRAAAAADPATAGRVEVAFQAMGGHDLDPAVAWPLTREFLSFRRLEP